MDKGGGSRRLEMEWVTPRGGLHSLEINYEWERRGFEDA